MKKIIFSIFFILVCMGLYINADELRQINKDVLTVWVTEEEYPVLSELNDQFEKQYNVQIKMEIVSPEQTVSKLPLANGSTTYPDIVTLNHTMISDMVNENVIEPLNDMFETLNILPTVKQGFKVKGNYYGVPYEAMTDILFYNEYSYPEGISSFTLLDENDEASILLNYQDIYHITPFITGFGGYIVGMNNFGDTNFFDIGLNREETIEGFLKMIQLLNKETAYTKEGDIYRAFIDNKSDFLIAPAYMVESLSQVYSNLGYQSIPNFVEEILPYTYMTIGTYQLTTKSQHKELAKEYLKFLISDEVATERYEQTKAIAPVDYEVPISQDTYYTVVKKQLHRAVPLPNQSEFNYLFLSYKEAATKFMTMPDQLQSIMNDVVKEIDKQLEAVLK
ncbi:MAG TPA: ABC transporter substrate-binding protein [Firmicutes bacterium]|nr:ABC transporter substrate-binding protein [Bacillota bacterium]